MNATDLERLLLTRLRLRQLSAFVAVYENRNIVKAAEQLSLSQSTVSKTIREIEVDLDLVLFIRSPRGVTPTPFADVLYRHMKSILGEFRSTANELAMVAGGERGQVCIGVTPASTALLARAVAAFKAAQPSVSVSVVQGTDDVLLSALRLGEIDFVFGRVYEDHRRGGLKREPLFEDPLRVILRSGHRLLKRRGLRLRDLHGEPWVLPHPKAYIRPIIDTAFAQEGLPPPPNVVETVSINLTRALMLDADMMTASPEDTYSRELGIGVLRGLPIDLDVDLNPIGVSLRANGSLSPPAERLLDKIRLAAKSFGPQARTE
jgi:DNA-binding transcriptional LysR family regulator